METEPERVPPLEHALTSKLLPKNHENRYEGMKGERERKINIAKEHLWKKDLQLSVEHTMSQLNCLKKLWLVFIAGILGSAHLAMVKF